MKEVSLSTLGTKLLPTTGNTALNISGSLYGCPMNL
jgi:hypothetical protein